MVYNEGFDLNICAVGDISLAYYSNNNAICDDDVSKYLHNADLVLANMEYVVKDNYIRSEEICLVESPSSVKTLKDLGIEVVSLANNHIVDYGTEGLLCTKNTLEKYGIKYCGAGINEDEARKPVIIYKRGKTVAIFGRILDECFEEAAPIVARRDKFGAAKLTYEDIDECVRDYRSKADYMIMFVHWGMQLMNNHSNKMERVGEYLRKSGFDIVFGSHAHVIQGVSDAIYYGLGNFYFHPIPHNQFLGGLLYGPRYKRNRISEIAVVGLKDGKVGFSSLQMIYQDVDEIVKFLPNKYASKYVKNIFGKENDMKGGIDNAGN